MPALRLPSAPAPLLPPEGLTDENGWSWPGTEWKQVSPESEGFSAERLDALRSFLKTHQTDGMMIISRGHLVFEYGDTKLVSKVASVRKSMLSLLYAVEMQKGVKFDLDQTVVQLGLEDKTPFIESERHATLQQLLMSRSGIYIRSGNDGQDKLSPKRGSSYPGVRWFYNNWDFDAAGIAFEKIAQKDIFDALRDDLAVPLRFQDFDRSKQRKNYVENSTHFEYATYLSTRDMARLGLLAISHGMWGKTLWAEPGFLDLQRLSEHELCWTERIQGGGLDRALGLRNALVGVGSTRVFGKCLDWSISGSVLCDGRRRAVHHGVSFL